MWVPPSGYKGLRTKYRQSLRVVARAKLGMSLIEHRQRVLEMEEWCEENCQFNWSYDGVWWWFDKQQEAVMFKMIFGGQ